MDSHTRSHAHTRAHTSHTDHAPCICLSVCLGLAKRQKARILLASTSEVYGGVCVCVHIPHIRHCSLTLSRAFNGASFIYTYSTLRTSRSQRGTTTVAGHVCTYVCSSFPSPSPSPSPSLLSLRQLYTTTRP